jgi:dimethylaniline monooxygenase (N-oxide forming)
MKIQKKIPMSFIFFNRKTAYNYDRFENREDAYSCKNKFLSKICASQNFIQELFIDPNSTDAPHIAISEDYIDLVKEKKMKIKKGFIQYFTENGVIFDDGTFENAEFIVFCTGYSLDLSFMESEILKKIDYDMNDIHYPYIVYKGTFHPDFENLAFVGMEKSFFPAIELQARWASLVFNRKISLPLKEIMFNAILKEKELRKLGTNERAPRYNGFVKFSDEIAKEINEIPDFEKVRFENPRLFTILWEGPLSAVHFVLEKNDGSILGVLDEIENEMK